MSRFVLRVREQHIGNQPIFSLWLLSQDTGARTGLMHGDMRPETAAKVLELMQQIDVKVERDGPHKWAKGSEPTVEERISETEKQGVMF